MAYEVLRGEDCRLVFTHKKQSAYGTQIPDSDIEAGHACRANVWTFGSRTPMKVGAGARAFEGNEWGDGAQERIIAYDSGISLSMDLNSWIAGWAFSFLLQDLTSTQEGATGHYNHELHPLNPLTAVTGTRICPVTSVFMDSAGPDAGRWMRMLYDLAVVGITISGRRKEMIQISIDCQGSGREDLAPTITVPSDATIYEIDGQNVTVEYGTKGGALTDITERVTEWSLSFRLGMSDGFNPGSGQYRGKAQYLTRAFSIDLALDVDRSSHDIYDHMLALTRKELLFTMDSGVAAGTSETTNHQVVCRYPDVRISESPMQMAADGAQYAVRVAENNIFKDSAVSDSPVTVDVDNATAAYLTAAS